VWVVSLVGAIALLDIGRPDLLELALAGLCLLAFVDDQLRTLELALLAVLSGLAVMVKLNIGAQAFLLSLSACALTSGRRLPVMLAVLAASLAEFYFLATGHLLALVSYLKNGWEIGSGYSASMGAVGPLWQLAAALAAMAASIGFRATTVWARLAPAFD
jgi:hypothetical protein